MVRDFGSSYPWTWKTSFAGNELTGLNPVGGQLDLSARGYEISYTRQNTSRIILIVHTMPRRKNPNWASGGRPSVPPAQLTDFEQQVRRLGLTEATSMTSRELKDWCIQNRHRCYIPESLLKKWGLSVDPDQPVEFRRRHSNLLQTNQHITSNCSDNPSSLIIDSSGNPDCLGQAAACY